MMFLHDGDGDDDDGDGNDDDVDGGVVYVHDDHSCCDVDEL